MRKFQIASYTDSGVQFDEIWTEKDILHSDWAKIWFTRAVDSGKCYDISDKNCLEDWLVINWALELLEDGTTKTPDCVLENLERWG